MVVARVRDTVPGRRLQRAVADRSDGGRRRTLGCTRLRVLLAVPRRHRGGLRDRLALDHQARERQPERRVTPMLVQFFLHLKSFRLPVSTWEFLTLLEALDSRVVSTSLDDFYVLSRACLVKDEQLFDRFDVAFGTYFKG